MNITHEQLKQIIKEELEATLKEGWFSDLGLRMMGQKPEQAEPEQTEPEEKAAETSDSTISDFEETHVHAKYFEDWSKLVRDYGIALMSNKKLKNDVMQILLQYVDDVKRDNLPPRHPLDYAYTKAAGGIGQGPLKTKEGQHEAWLRLMRADGAPV